MMKSLLLSVLVLSMTACSKDQATDAKTEPAAPTEAPAAVEAVAAPAQGAGAAVDKTAAAKGATPGTIAMPSGSVRVTADGKGNKVVVDNKGGSAAVDDKGASAVTGAAGTKLTDSNGRQVVIGKDGKVSVPGLGQVPATP